jgi:hypothetical protein
MSKRFLICLLCVVAIGVLASFSLVAITVGNEEPIILATGDVDQGSSEGIAVKEESDALSGLPPKVIVEIEARDSAVETVTIAAMMAEDMAICHEKQEVLAAVFGYELPPPQRIIQVTMSQDNGGVELWAIGRAVPAIWSDGLLRRTATTKATIT